MAALGDDRKTHQHRKQSLFQAIDSDGSGQIDKNEFGKLYDVIKAEAQQELAKEAALENKAKKSERRTKMFACVSAILLAFLGISVVANFAVSYVAANMMKDTFVDPKDAQGAISKTSTGGVVATGKVYNNMNVQDMPKRVDGKIPVAFYDNLKMVAFQDFDGKAKALKITGWKWFSDDTMVLEAGSKGELLIMTGGVLHVRPTGKIKWANIKSTLTLTNINASQAWEAQAQSKCQSLACPLSMCSAYTSEFLGGLYSVKCDDIQRWKYDEDLGNPQARRKLIAPVVIAMWAIRAAPVVAEIVGGLVGPPTLGSSMVGAAATAVGLFIN
jgi:hypothetical protein